MFHRVVTRGHLLVYEPRAIVWHRHRRSAAQLRQQLYDNGRSYGAYLTCARNGTVSRTAALRFAAIEWFARGLLARLLRPRGLPRTFILAELQGAFWSPLAYSAAQARARELLATAGSVPPGVP